MKQIINLSPLFLAVFFFSCSDEQRFVPQPQPTDSDKKQEETTNPSNPSDSNDLSLTDEDSAKDNSVSDKVSTTEEVRSSEAPATEEVTSSEAPVSNTASTDDVMIPYSDFLKITSDENNEVVKEETASSSEAPAAEEAVSDEIVFDDNIVSSEDPVSNTASTDDVMIPYSDFLKIISDKNNEVVKEETASSSEASAEKPTEAEPATETPVAEEASEVESTEAEPAVDASATDDQDDATQSPADEITFDGNDTITISNNANLTGRTVRFAIVDSNGIIVDYIKNDTNQTKFSVSKLTTNLTEKDKKFGILIMVQDVNGDRLSHIFCNNEIK